MKRAMIVLGIMLFAGAVFAQTYSNISSAIHGPLEYEIGTNTYEYPRYSAIFMYFKVTNVTDSIV
ncbi:MAG: hypothetical protein ACP5G4_05115, partial [bacterium]